MLSMDLSTTCHIHSCSVTVIMASTGSKSVWKWDAFFALRTSSSSFFLPLTGVVRTRLRLFLSILLLSLRLCTHPILRPQSRSKVNFFTLNRYWEIAAEGVDFVSASRVLATWLMGLPALTQKIMMRNGEPKLTIVC